MSFELAPKGWTPYDGQLLPINQNQALFSLLGTTFVGSVRWPVEPVSRTALISALVPGSSGLCTTASRSAVTMSESATCQ